jgi:hypothetical protein
MGCVQIIPDKWVMAVFPFLTGKPRLWPGLFLISNLIIEDWVELTCHADVVDSLSVRWLWGLTFDFWAENAERKFTGGLSAIG